MCTSSLLYKTTLIATSHIHARKIVILLQRKKFNFTAIIRKNGGLLIHRRRSGWMQNGKLLSFLYSNISIVMYKEATMIGEYIPQFIHSTFLPDGDNVLQLRLVFTDYLQFKSSPFTLMYGRRT